MNGVDPASFTGRALGKARWDLEAILHDLDLPGIGEFVSFSSEEVETLAVDMQYAMPRADHAERWSPSEAGVTAVCALSHHIKENPGAVKDETAVLAELEAMRCIIEAAARAHVRFRLTIDY